MRPVVLILLVVLAACGPNAGRCTVLTKGYPLCGL
jgi:hypothetical protein